MEERRVKIGGYYFMKERLKSYNPTDWIMRVSGWGDEVPVPIYGLLMNRKTGDIRVAKRVGNIEVFFGGGNEHVFACEIGKEIPAEEFQKIKEDLLKKIGDFFEMPLDEFLKSYEPRK